MIAERRVRRVPPSPGTTAAVAGVVVAAYVFCWLVGLDLGVRPPLPARIQADGLTGLVSLLADLTARLAALAALGALAGHVAFGREARLPRLAGRAAQVWFVAALLCSVVNPAYVTGVPMGAALPPANWWLFLWAAPSALAWFVSALVALGVVAACYLTDTAGARVLALGAGVLAQTFVLVTGNVTVGLDHDWATDAAIVLTLVLTPLGAGAVGVWLLGDPDAVGRYHRAVPGAVAVSALSLVVVARQQLAGAPVAAVMYGIPVLGQFGVLAALLVSWLWRRFSGEMDAARPARALASVARDVALVIAWAAFAAAENHIPPPRFLEPQSIQVNYLGYEVVLAPTVGRLLGPGRPNLLWVVIVAAVVAAYVWGMVRARRHGVRWSPLRLLAWCSAWLLTCYLAVSGLWEYSTAMYSWHMVVHMTVNMLVPVLAVLGGPLSLIRAASGPHAAPTSVGGLVAAVEGNRVWRLLTSPPVAWLGYVGGLFLVYFTPLFPWLMRYHWAHQLMLLFFMVTGYLFFNLIVGVDPTSWHLPHLVKLALVISIMPFHAIFAVGILSAHSLIGGEFYETLAIPWMTDLLADQNVAGQWTWILGEVPLFIVMLALAAQWFRSDTSDAARLDAAADAGEDDSFAAYNDMLAELARRDAERRQ